MNGLGASGSVSMSINDAHIQVSVVIPAFNAEKYIVEAIESVLSQECSLTYELLVVDDGSVDNTADVVSQLASISPHLQLVKKSNGGPGSARNAGVHAAKAEIILFLDADDLMLPGRLEHQGRYMLSNRHVSVSFGALIVQDALGSAHTEWSLPVPVDFGFVEIDRPFNRLMASGSFVGNPASAVRREDYLSIGMQRSDLMVAEDYDLWCRLAVSGRRFFKTDTPYTWQRREGHGNLMSSVHTYRGETIVLMEQLRLHAPSLSPDERALAKARLDWRANMYLRHLWAFDRPNLDAAIAELSGSVSPKIIGRWRRMKMVPGWFGRIGRRFKHRLAP